MPCVQVSLLASRIGHETLAGMRQAVRALRSTPGPAERAERWHSRDSTADPAVSRTATTAWTGPPHGTFLTYALLQWASASPGAAHGLPATSIAHEASALLNGLSVSYNRSRRDGNAHGEPGDESSSPLLFLPHPILLQQHQQRQHGQMQHQENKHGQMAAQAEVQQQRIALAAVRRLHTLQQKLLRCEQLMLCTNVLQQLMQLLQACMRAPDPKVFGLPHPNSDNNRHWMRAAAAQVLRLSAFLLEAGRRRPLCGARAMQGSCSSVGRSIQNN